MTNLSTWPEVLSKLIRSEDIGREGASWALEEIMSGAATDSQIGAFLIGPRSKGETVEELAGLVDTMLKNAIRPEVSNRAVDIVGTGGDQLGTVNISTMAAIVTAGSGYPVLKHGSRSASGKTGSSEFLEALGVKLDVAHERLGDIFDNLGIGFFFAPLFHPALKNVAGVRKELGVPTTFNFLGPLANPIQPVATALGVANKDFLPLMAQEMAARGRSALVFRGQDGLDELTTTGKSSVYIIFSGNAKLIEFDPQLLGLARSSIQDLIGGSPHENAIIAKDLFAGNLGENAVFEVVSLNAAAAMTAFDLATSDAFDFESSMAANLVKAMDTIREGRASKLLQAWAEESHR